MHNKCSQLRWKSFSNTPQPDRQTIFDCCCWWWNFQLCTTEKRTIFFAIYFFKLIIARLQEQILLYIFHFLYFVHIFFIKSQNRDGIKNWDGVNLNIITHHHKHPISTLGASVMQSRRKIRAIFTHFRIAFSLVNNIISGRSMEDRAQPTQHSSEQNK